MGIKQGLNNQLSLIQKWCGALNDYTFWFVRNLLIMFKTISNIEYCLRRILLNNEEKNAIELFVYIAEYFY